MEEIAQLSSPAFQKPLLVKKGITDQQINQLIHYAQTDPIVQKFTSDAHRFANIEAFKSWKKPNTVFYTLTNRNEELLGIIWFEDLEIPEFTPESSSTDYQLLTTNYKTTFAIRLYGEARGKGLSTLFTQAALKDYKHTPNSHLPTPNQIWLATSPDNYPAIKSYEKIGFISVGLRKDSKKIIMIYRDKS